MAEAQPTTLPRRRRTLTPKGIEALAPRAQRYDVSDGGAPGLVLRVLPSGAKSFRWYVSSLARVITIGPWAAEPTPAHVTLREAREWLGRFKEARVAGPAQLDAVVRRLEEHLHPPAPPEGAGKTVKDMAEEFLTRRIGPHRKRPEEARYVLEKDILPSLGSYPCDWFDAHPKDGRRVIAGVVAKVVDRGAVNHAGKVLGLVKQLFRYGEAQGFVAFNPAAPLDATDLGVVNGSRERWLTAEEIPLLWRALTPAEGEDPGKMAPATRVAFKILLLTGVRGGELRLAAWEHVDLDAATWTIPVENQKLSPKQAKAAQPWVVPLAPMVVDLFRELKEETGKTKHVLIVPAISKEPLTDKVLGRALRRLQEPEKAGQAPALILPGGLVAPHDLRRTMRTHLTGKVLRVSPHIAERCLNHRLGKLVATYDRGDYLEERREALEKWAEYVARLTGQPAKVIPLAEGARS